MFCLTLVVILSASACLGDGLRLSFDPPRGNQIVAKAAAQAMSQAKARVLPIFLTASLTIPLVVNADSADSAGEYVREVGEKIHRASFVSHSTGEVYSAFEDVRDMIQDGKGIGGQVDLKGNIMINEKNRCVVLCCALLCFAVRLIARAMIA